MLRRLKKGQSTAEYAIVIGLVIAAAVGMQIYVKRAIQAKVRDATNYTEPVTADGYTAGDYGVGGANALEQYEPRYTVTDAPMMSERNATEETTFSKGGAVTRNIIGNEVTTRTGTQNILSPAEADQP